MKRESPRDRRNSVSRAYRGVANRDYLWPGTAGMVYAPVAPGQAPIARASPSPEIRAAGQQRAISKARSDQPQETRPVRLGRQATTPIVRQRTTGTSESQGVKFFVSFGLRFDLGPSFLNASCQLHTPCQGRDAARNHSSICVPTPWQFTTSDRAERRLVHTVFAIESSAAPPLDDRCPRFGQSLGHPFSLLPSTIGRLEVCPTSSVAMAAVPCGESAV